MIRSVSRLALVVFVALAAMARDGQSQTPAEQARTASWIAALQNPDGGFAPSPGGPSNLNATSSAVKALKYTGGSVPDVLKCIAYLRSCHDPASGGFASTPGGAPDVPATALGLQAVAELHLDPAPFVEPAIKFFHEKARTFEEIRLAAAGLEPMKAASPDFPDWRKVVEADRNDDGTWGSGASRGRATGGAAAALLRMGFELDRKDNVLNAMRSDQAADGGYPDGPDRPGDLGSTYRVMRAFFLMKESPDLDRVRAFVQKHRNDDGSSSPAPGKTADLSATYMTAIILWWTRQLEGRPAVVEVAGFRPLFNGKNLDGWQGDDTVWKVRGHQLVGGTPEALKHNDFLATTSSHGDFVLKAVFRVKGGPEANSGIMLRAERVPGTEMSGYQADIGQNYWGCLYDESRRNKVIAQASPRAQGAVRRDGWNHYVIRAIGDRIDLTLNDVPSASWTETDPAIPRAGRIATQVHAGPPIEVTFEDILIQDLPTPKLDDAATPGFHLRALDGGRKYAVWLPPGFDKSKKMPVILFLHGAGERGADGVAPTRAGIGPALLNSPGSFPAIVVLPQAERTWQAGSDDANDALKALDAAIKDFGGDPDRVVLTGLSMGGMGTWSVGSANPGRFLAFAPICGPGDPTKVVPALGNKPVWAFCGDGDNARFVAGMRSMLTALRDAGNPARYTEYRGVGHNSWDRAYADPALASWLVSQGRPTE
jgi:prenyltransferase beta subunit/predicted esterase